LLRIAGGELKGRKLSTVKGSLVRPTSEKVREAIFDIMRPVVTDEAFLDLFAGTGGMGIEALSQGVMRAVFIEKNARVISVLRENINNLHLEDRAQIIPLSVTRGLRLLKMRGEQFRLIFLDPPYHSNLVEKALLELSEAKVVAENGIVIAEHPSNEIVKASYEDLVLDDRRQYGQTLISFFTYHA
jgi:16S rRNA (guanine966-N2)-methyltransferase